MELQIPHRFYTQIPQADYLPPDFGRHWSDYPTLCARKGVEIIEAAAMPDHIHLYVAIPPKYSVSEFMGYLKGKSSLMIFDRHANLKYKYGNRHFWCRGYYVDTVGRNEKTIKEYVRNQLQEDIASDQMCLKEFTDPFTGKPVAKGKSRPPAKPVA